MTTFILTIIGTVLIFFFIGIHAICTYVSVLGGAILAIVTIGLGAACIYMTFNYYGEKYRDIKVALSVVFGVVLCIGLIWGMSVLADNDNYDPNAVNPDHYVQCKSCDREFENTSSNAKSIRRTNMCTNCYTNYQYGKDLLD